MTHVAWGAVGFVAGIVITRRLITLPSSQVLFDKFDQRGIDEIVADEEDVELDGGSAGNPGGAFTFPFLGTNLGGR